MLLEIENLTKIYSNVLALDNVSVSIEEGKIVGLLGPNGSGKTTMLKIVAGILKRNSGNVKVDGKEIGIDSKAIVSYLPERTYFDSNLKVKDTLDFFEDFYKDFDRSRAEQMLSVLGVKLDRKMKELSKGTKEKVQLVLVMSRRAKLYLLDEPIGGVDPATRDFIINTVLKNYERTSSIIISTHLISDVEEILDEYVFLRDGVILEHGDVTKCREEYNQTLDERFREVFKCY